jgi:hypothetical protein
VLKTLGVGVNPLNCTPFSPGTRPGIDCILTLERGTVGVTAFLGFNQLATDVKMFDIVLNVYK